MQKFIFVLLLTVSILANASQVDEWLDGLDHPLHRSLTLKPKNLLQKYISYDISSLLIPRSEFLGYIGNNYQRLHIHFKSVSRSPTNQEQYLIIGESIVGDHVTEFNGEITVTSVREYVKMHFGLDDELKTAGIQSEGLIIGHFKFQEQSTQSSSGRFQGIVTLYWYKDKAGNVQYDDIAAGYSDNYSNNQYVGTWKAYRTGKEKTANWGEQRIPFSGDLDIGAAQFSPAPQFKKQGW